MSTFTYGDVRSVFRFKVTTNYSGPHPMRIETISLCAVKLSDALTFVYNSFDNVHSVEILERLDCVML